MNTNYKMIGFLVSLFLIIMSCQSNQDRIQTQLDAFSIPNSTLLHKHSGVSSSATGNCAGTFIDYWYGSDIPYNDIDIILENEFFGNRWGLWPEDVVRIWRKQTETGLFSLSKQVTTKENITNVSGGLYKLPDSLYHEVKNYSTIYIISLDYMASSNAKSCFGK